MSNEGGVIFDFYRINDYQEQRRSYKLSLFLDFGCKPMKDVILHTYRHNVRCPGTSIQRLEQSQIVKNGMQIESAAIKDICGCRECCALAMHIKAIPEKIDKDGFDSNVEYAQRQVWMVKYRELI